MDDEEDPERKGRYKFPYGDFEKVHRCGLLAAESRAGQRKYHDIELAVTEPARHGRGAAAEAGSRRLVPRRYRPVTVSGPRPPRQCPPGASTPTTTTSRTAR